MSIWKNIRGFEELSLSDWPGKMVAVLFTGGCNFACPTCHNWKLATAPHSIDPVPHDEVMSYLKSKRSWLDGIVITGGEPTINPGLIDLLREIKELGYPVNLHTNGFRPDVVKTVLEQNLVEVVSVDVKGSWGMYHWLTGDKADAKSAERNLSKIFDMAATDWKGRFYFRTTLVPLVSMCEDALDFCRSYLPEGYELHTQEYRVPEQLKSEKELDEEFGCVLIVDDETNEDLAEVSGSEVTLRLQLLGIDDPVAAIRAGKAPGLTIIDNL